MYTDLEKENLQGKVKSVTTFDYFKKEKSNVPTVCKTTYNPKGYMIEYEQLYDVDDTQGVILFKETFIRDKADKIIESFFINTHTGEVRHIERFSYDSLGRKIKGQEFWYKDNAIESTKTTQYHYDEQFNSRVIFYEDDIQIDKTEKHFFDHNGHLVEKQEFNLRDSKIPLHKTIYQYNEQGKLTRKFVFLKDEIKENTATQCGEIFVYNERGDVEKKTLLCGSCPHDENNLDWKEYVYTNFDKYGNWLQQTSVDIIPHIIIRQISYYE